MKADQCVHQPREGRGRNRQTPPQKKTEGGNPHPTTNAHPPANGIDGKRGGQRHDHEAAHPSHKRRATPPARQHQRRHPRGPPIEHRGTSPPSPATPSQKQRPTTTTWPPKGRRKGHPGHAGAHPTGEVPGRRPHGHGKNKKRRRTPNERGQGGGEQGAQDRDRQRRPPQSHNTTGPRTKPIEPPLPRSQTEKKEKRAGGGGETPPTATPTQPHATGSPTRGWRGTDGARAKEQTPQHPSQKKPGARKTQTHTHTPQTRARNGGAQPKPSPNTHTLDPSQEWRGYRGTQPQTHAPRTPARNGGAKPKPGPKHTHPGPRPGMAGSPRNPDPNASTTQQ